MRKARSRKERKKGREAEEVEPKRGMKAGTDFRAQAVAKLLATNVETLVSASLAFVKCWQALKAAVLDQALAKMPLTAQVRPGIEDDPVFKEIETPFLRAGISIRRCGLHVKDKAAVSGVLQALSNVNNNVAAVATLFSQYYTFTGEVDVSEDLRTKLKLPVKDIQPVINSIRALASELGMQSPDVTEL